MITVSALVGTVLLTTFAFLRALRAKAATILPVMVIVAVLPALVPDLT